MLKALFFVSLMAIMQVWASPIEGQDAHKQAMRYWWNSYQKEGQAPKSLVARDTSPSIVPLWRPADWNPPWRPSPPPWRPPPPVWNPPWRPPPWKPRDN
ncbi:hypothetical protein HPULCUR_001188 [Helicostylum pulchrum]|uniref:Uncharacterized protein n=1 Tax=Helicostylum pulchrum TaxID=562976 RepID=A0ABP9XLZ3_9FUNG